MTTHPTDVVVVGDQATGLDSLTREAVVGLLERGKTWLELALARDAEVSDLAGFKAQAETVRTLSPLRTIGCPAGVWADPDVAVRAGAGPPAAGAR